MHRKFGKSDIVRIATDAMLLHGLEPDFSLKAEEQIASIHGPGHESGPDILDLTSLLWCSIDNDDSLDLDQLTACEMPTDLSVIIYVAIADVDALVKKGSPIDNHARINTTSVYTSAHVFPMLPLRLSTDLTSLNPDQNRLALVTIMKTDVHGAVVISSTVERALVRNKAKLAYDGLSAWIEGESELPLAASAVPGMNKQLRCQDAVAQKLRLQRHSKGSLEFQTFQPHAVFEGERVVAIKQQEQNRARQLIEEFMIATNACTASFLAEKGVASFRRVVRSPERWMRIAEVANEYGYSLPGEPDAEALEAFLAARHKADPLRFPDLSLVIIKLMGSGEYVVEVPGEEAIGHFGLAERDYTHSTAPNRRYPDLITLRMMKAILTNTPAPYGVDELEYLAAHCTRQEDAARKVERRVSKSEAALLLGPKIGSQFDAIVTGHSDKGTWVRLLNLPAEGRLMRKIGTIKVGQQIKVKLVLADVERGFIDFERM
jgi:exoribonuclease-2